eukprot:759654-Hanusia_phi.AAC.1
MVMLVMMMQLLLLMLLLRLLLLMMILLLLLRPAPFPARLTLSGGCRGLDSEDLERGGQI